jgi:molybdate transport system substrate-binding protein
MRRLALALFTLAALATGAPAFAAQTQVAVAANFTAPAQAIAAAFHAATGHDAVLSFGASGLFYTQISKGAPFEVFLSADAERPAKAEADGLAAPRTRFTYAVGKLVLYSKTPGLIDGQGAVLAGGKFEKLAIADPGAAPYGAAAIETLKTLKLYDQLQPKIVQGASIAQAYQFVDSGAAELGFVALSQVIDQPGGSRWLVPQADYAPIVQQAVLLKTPAAVAIIKTYGYDVP